MKVAFTTQGENFDAKISQIFKQAEFFLIVDLDDVQNYKAIPNLYKDAWDGSEIFCAQLVISYGVQIVFTGFCNPNASRIFQEADIKIVEGVKGSIKKIMQSIGNKELIPSQMPQISNTASSR
jgi:predicted Fe-Mo cluster-binding NifX family protein